MFSNILSFLLTFSQIYGLLSLLIYLLPQLYQKLFYKPQNFKQKYNSEWGLVTGGSSGIGLAIVERLAKQGINVVVVALDDKHLDDIKSYLGRAYPNVEFRFVGVNLGANDSKVYMDPIIEQTSDLNINLVFNNAGYIQVGLFVQTPCEKTLANVNCNAISSIHITHYFAKRMKNGLISFTSSPGAFMGSPMASMYSSTKSFVTNFASSIAGELKDEGIDVVVVHPSPTNSGFYKNAGLLSTLKVFQKTAVSPVEIVDMVFSAAGKTCVVDHGYYSIINRLLLKVLDVTVMTDLMTTFVSGQNDFKLIKADGQQKYE